MAENTTEESITESLENEMSLISKNSSADDSAVSSDEKGKHEQIDVVKPSTSKEASDATTEKEKINDTDLLSIEKQQDASIIDCNGDLRLRLDLDLNRTLPSIDPIDYDSETKESNSDELQSLGTKSSEDGLIYSTTIQSNLNEILKIVHGDLAMDILRNSDSGTSAKDNDEGNDNEEQQETVNEEEQQESVNEEEHQERNNEEEQQGGNNEEEQQGGNNEEEQQGGNNEEEQQGGNSEEAQQGGNNEEAQQKENSEEENNEEEQQEGNNEEEEEQQQEGDNEEEQQEENIEQEQQTVQKENDAPTDDTASSSKKYTTSVAAKHKKDLKASSKKMEEKSNIEIVRSPTAIGELIEEQLANNSTLSTDRTDHIVEWVKNSVTATAHEESNTLEECKSENTTSEVEKRKRHSITPPFVSPRKSQKLVCNIIKKSIRCLNTRKMHAMEGAAESRRNVDTAEDDKTTRSSPSPSPKVPQSQQNGAALPEETAAAPTTSVGRGRPKKKDESRCDTEIPKGRQLLAGTSRQSATTSSDIVQPRHVKAGSEPVEIKKRKSSNGLVSPGNPRKKFRDNYTREEYISRIVGDDNETVEDLMAKADRLRADILALENLAHAKEREWNEILRKRKLKEEAYMRLERKIQTTAYMENDGELAETVPARSSLSLTDWENNDSTISASKDRSKERSFESKEDLGERSLDSLNSKKEKTTRISSQQRVTPPKTNGESSRKQNDTSSPESRQIGEGRQGAIVDVRSIIADHRLKHPETVPRRGRRMRNSNVNINLGAGGAMVETGHNADSRPSSTESCKSNPSTSDSINYKDMLVQFAKISQQGELSKVPQNYPDVTLHPVTPSSAQNTSQPTGSLLHGILTKAQTPRSTTFSPTLARLLTAPERERSSPAAAAAAAASATASMSQQSATTQHLLQTYQGSNLVSINDLLSSSKARTEITITPVVNTSAQSHSNDLIQVDDVEEETTVIDDRKGNSMVGRDGKQAKDNPPSPSAPPKCQGCIIRPAQFVCAGCGNQWYCSRSCQLAAWAAHSDHCPPEPENNKTKTNV